MTWLAVAAGGALGACARYGVSLVLPGVSGGFPWATLAVNVLGCAVLGWLLADPSRFAASPDVRTFLGTGVCGALTTFSTFSVEAVVLVQRNEPGHAALYVASSLVVGFAAAAVGFWVGRP